jgi:hypothetical protein
MGNPDLEIFSYVHHHQIDDKLQAYNLFKMAHLELDFSAMMTITPDVIFSWAI